MMQRKAQSLLEYSVLICIVVAALFAMRVYFKRSLQGRIRGYADEVSGGFSYSPGATNSNSTINKTVKEVSDTVSVRIGTKVAGSITDAATSISQNTVRNEEVLPLAQEPRR